MHRFAEWLFARRSCKDLASGRKGFDYDEHPRMSTPGHENLELELALLRRGVDDMAAESERCQRCRRTPLIGEHVYVYGSGAIACELCRTLQREAPIGSHRVHGPEFGHTMKITDQRRAA